MASIAVCAPAKINLILNVLGKRPDGFHEIESLFQTIDLCDDINIMRTAKGITISTDHPHLTNDSENIAFRAAQLMFDQFSLPGGIHIEIKKNIPLQGGLGGGSSDAAAVLKALNKLYSLGKSPTELERLGLGLGSDVPFFIRGGTGVVTGRGEQITPLAGLPEKKLLLITFPFGLSTAEVYANWWPRIRKNSKRGFPASCYLKWEEVMAYVGNDLQEAACTLQPNIQEILSLLKKEALGPAHLSGSGPSIIVHSEDQDGLEKLLAARDLKITPIKTLKKEFLVL